MKRQYLLVISLVFTILVGNFVVALGCLGATVVSPMVIAVQGDEYNDFSKPQVIGLTSAGTDVLIYIDNKLVGEAVINSNNTATDNFFFNYNELLEPGKHAVAAAARDKFTLATSSLSEAREFFVYELPAPTLLQPGRETVTGKVKPLITGLTREGTIVHFWIDGIYNGKTEWLKDDSGTASFAYEPFLNLAAEEHTVWAVAEDELGRKSRTSKTQTFTVEEPMPAPILLTPVVNNRTTRDKPLIVGLAKNDSRIKVYIDQVLNGEFLVENNQSGTASFAYQPFLPLSGGNHLVYTEAVDSRGKVSSWSNIVYFQVSGLIEPTISDQAAIEKSDTVGEIQEDTSKEDLAVTITPIEGTVEEVDVLGEELNDEEASPVEEEMIEAEPTSEEDEVNELIARVGEGEPGKTGILDESKQSQGRLQLNLIIFLVFLIAVIVWIFWVNRELIKERKELTELEDKAKKE